MSNRKTLFLVLAVAVGVAVGGAAVAQSMQDGQLHRSHGVPGGMHASTHDKGGGHGHGTAQATRGADESASSLAFRAANEKMHRDMVIAYSGDADADFVRGMIPHHQGAIDMAKIVIAFGKDPEVRKLAEEIVKAQEGEIALMRAWLANRGK